MKIVKRDGRIVDYDKSKIIIAIKKANADVDDKEKINDKQIDKIVLYIESLNKKRLLVEDIQDIIETKLMEAKKYVLAKAYIVYRYNRALVRKSNTTDESILRLIKNNNDGLKDEIKTNLAFTQRDYIAGEVSKDLTKRILLPEKISRAHQDGTIYFHDMDYFVQPIFDASYVNMEDMLNNGTVMNGKKIETPKSFRVACILMTQIMTMIASNQYGGQSVDLSVLGLFLHKSYEKIKTDLKRRLPNISEEDFKRVSKEVLGDELRSGVQSTQYQINTLITSNGKPPFVTFFLNLDKDDPYIDENAMIYEELLKAQIKGMKDEDGKDTYLEFPRVVYVLNDLNNLDDGPYDYLTELAINAAIKTKTIDFISAKKMQELYKGRIFAPIGNNTFLPPYKDENGKYKFIGRFDQGRVSINLPKVAFIADHDKEKFMTTLNEHLELCKEALMCKHYALFSATLETSPIHYKYGAIARSKDVKVDRFLRNGYAPLLLDYVGLEEAVRIMTDNDLNSASGRNFGLEILNAIKTKIDLWNDELKLGFVLYSGDNTYVDKYFALKDSEVYSVRVSAYTSSCYLKDLNISMYDKLEYEKEIFKISTGGFKSLVDVSMIKDDYIELKSLIKYLYNNTLCANIYAEGDKKC